MPARKSSAARSGHGRISVLVAEDHGVLRDGLLSIFKGQRDISVAAAVGDGSAAVREVERHLPQVALLGITMTGLNGIEAARIITEKSPGVAVVILSTHSSPMVVRRALEAGALGYLTRECSAEELLKAIRAVAAGKRYLGQGLAENFIDVYRGVQRGDRAVENLTATERNILKLVAEGKSNLKVAEMLGLSPRTVETYRLRLMRKLGIEDLASLVKYAVRNGMVPLD